MFCWCTAAGNVLHHTYPPEYQISSSQPRQKSCWASTLVYTYVYNLLVLSLLLIHGGDPESGCASCTVHTFTEQLMFSLSPHCVSFIANAVYRGQALQLFFFQLFSIIDSALESAIYYLLWTKVQLVQCSHIFIFT